MMTTAETLEHRKNFAIAKLDALASRLFWDKKIAAYKDECLPVVLEVMNQIAEGRTKVDTMTACRFARNPDRAAAMVADVLLGVVRKYPD